MDKAHPSMQPKMVEQAMAREKSTQQLQGEQSAILTTSKEDQPTTVKQPDRITSTLITSVVSTIQQESIEPEPEESDQTISISSTSTAN